MADGTGAGGPGKRTIALMLEPARVAADNSCPRPVSPGAGAALYQSDPSTSPPLGVQAAHQASPLRLADRKRTLPSPMQTFMPATSGEEAYRRCRGSRPAKKGCSCATAPDPPA